jgi:hypothetical protein
MIPKSGYRFSEKIIRQDESGAEGETAPETLRQKDRKGMTLWKAAARNSRGSPTE